MLKARPLTCYRYMERGHTTKNCTLDKDRSSRCYNCGGEGHRAKQCTASSKCCVCSDAGKPANHRFGGKACDPPNNRRKRGAKEPEASVGEVPPPTSEVATTRGAGNQTTPEQNTQECGREEVMEIVE